MENTNLKRLFKFAALEGSIAYKTHIEASDHPNCVDGVKCQVALENPPQALFGPFSRKLMALAHKIKQELSDNLYDQLLKEFNTAWETRAIKLQRFRDEKTSVGRAWHCTNCP